MEKMINDSSVQGATISAYIHRFRYAAPTAPDKRQDLRESRKAFWWLEEGDENEISHNKPLDNSIPSATNTPYDSLEAQSISRLGKQKEISQQITQAVPSNLVLTTTITSEIVNIAKKPTISGENEFVGDLKLSKEKEVCVSFDSTKVKHTKNTLLDHDSFQSQLQQSCKSFAVDESDREIDIQQILRECDQLIEDYRDETRQLTTTTASNYDNNRNTNHSISDSSKLELVGRHSSPRNLEANKQEIRTTDAITGILPSISSRPLNNSKLASTATLDEEDDYPARFDSDDEEEDYDDDDDVINSEEARRILARLKEEYDDEDDDEEEDYIAIAIKSPATSCSSLDNDLSQHAVDKPVEPILTPPLHTAASPVQRSIIQELFSPVPPLSTPGMSLNFHLSSSSEGLLSPIRQARALRELENDSQQHIDTSDEDIIHAPNTSALHQQDQPPVVDIGYVKDYLDDDVVSQLWQRLQHLRKLQQPSKLCTKEKEEDSVCK